MTIEWNKVTWYSKLAAVIVFVGTFFLAFWLGTMKTEMVFVEAPQLVQQHASTTLQAGVVHQEAQKENGLIDLVLKNLGGDYFTDGINIYEQVWPNHFQYHLEIADKFDPQTFEVLGKCWESGNATRIYYTKDKAGVYCGGKILPDADIHSFEVLNYSIGHNVHDDGIVYIGRDNNNVFTPWGVLPNISSKTFVQIGENYIGDATKIYYYDLNYNVLTEVVGADRASFQVVPFSWDTYLGYAKDKNQYYERGVAVHGNIPDHILIFFGPS